MHFKWWQIKVKFYLTAKNMFHVSKGKPDGILTPEDEKKYDDTNIIFTGVIFSVLVNRPGDANMQYTDEKEL
jgi:hypothetical protein